MDLAVECGAAPDDVELFGCTLFFKDEYNRIDAERNFEADGNSEAEGESSGSSSDGDV
ncbi:hypothetical protein C2845_PM10G19500 [Panicum miliaceum]|uniref:Uncharacterized protein n=1 Tax=Panicum miliaceum TaxID=4540 RepID=A0A3L6PEK9_PANMI|nr:hypothetical protein C2845_PM10G19500 [Panicum miliaceum]